LIRTNPYVFTEQGVYMLATVLKSSIAVEVTKQIMLTLPYFDIIKRLKKLETNDKDRVRLALIEFRLGETQFYSLQKRGADMEDIARSAKINESSLSGSLFDY